MYTIRAGALGLDPRVCRGVVVGGCRLRGESYDRFSKRSINAHAHNHARDPAYGWICVAEERFAVTASGNLSRVLLHEYAHLLTPNRRHGRQWQNAVTTLGWPSEARRYGGQ
jgi:hypothetical protein